MDFFVYDNISTFNKKVPFNGNPNTRLSITEVCLTEIGAFWFSTEMKKEIRTVNVNAPYVHIHPGIVALNRAQFNEKPLVINKPMMKYNPKTRCVEVKKWLLGKIVWKKRVLYYGQQLPSHKMSCLGSWFYNYHLDSIMLILDYFPQNKAFKYTVENAISEEEQRNRMNQLQTELNTIRKELDTEISSPTNV